MNFPSSPTLNQTYTFNGITWKWNGEGWELVVTDPFATYTASDVLTKLLTVDGPGTGLNADLLDGFEASYFLPASSYNSADILAKLVNVDGPGSGLDADTLDGQQGSYYLPAASYTAADVLAKLLTVDGAGTGLDADTLDGLQGSYYGRFVASTTFGSTGTEDGANTWAKLASYDCPSQFSDSTFIYGLNSSSASGQQTAIISVFVRSNATGTAPGLAVDYLAAAGNWSLADDSFKLIANANHTGFELWVRKTTTYDSFDMYEVSRRLGGSCTATYFTNSAWQSATPTGSVLNASSSGLRFRNNTVWHAGNDGASSGLDADVLDGQQGSYYLDLANATGTLPDARITAANLVTKDGSKLYTVGNVGAGTTNVWYEVFTWTVTSQYQGFQAKIDIEKRATSLSRATVHVRGEYDASTWNTPYCTASYVGDFLTSEDKFLMVYNDTTKTAKLYYSRTGDWNNTYAVVRTNYLAGATFTYTNTSTGSTTAPTGNIVVAANNTTNNVQYFTVLNDGSGSSLDADLLDGQHGSYYTDLTNATGALAAARLPAFSGDVSSSAGSSTLTIGNGTVSLAKQANLAANSIIGNNTGSAATPIALTGAQVKAMLSLAKGDVGLGNVENTALSTWAGSSNITTLGTIATGTWQGSVIGPAYLGTGTRDGTKFLRDDGTYQGIPGGVSTLSALSDVSLGTPASGEFLRHNGTAWVDAALVAGDIPNLDWAKITSGKPTTLSGYGITDAASSTHNHTLDSLSNVTITANASGEILKWNGSAWINNTLAEAGIQPAGSYLTANQTITLSGDVSGSGTTAITATIGANKVTLGMMATVATGVFLGRNTASTGNVEAMTVSQAKTLLALVKGDVGLGNVENTALSTWAGSANITTVGTLASGSIPVSLLTGTLAAARMPALTGDVTTSAGAVATTIANGAVSLAKMANLAANSFIGNNTGSAATPIALTVAQAKTLLALVKGDVGLGNVENTALSTWAGSANITTLGTIATGTWNGSVIGPAYLGTGTRDGTKFLRDDGTYQNVSASWNGGTVTNPVTLSLGAVSTNPFSISGDFTSTGRFIGITNTNTGTVSQMGIQLKAGSGGGSYLTEFALEYTSNATQTGRFSMVSSNNGLLFNASGASGDHVWTQGASLTEVMRLNGTTLSLGSPVKSIVADFGNTTAGSRAAFQPLGANDYCVVGAIPNGTGTLAIFRAWGTSDIANSHSMDLYATTTETFINSGYTGTGTQRDIGVKFQGSLKFTFGSGGTFTAEDGPIATKGALACVNFYDRTSDPTPWVGYNTGNIFRLYRAGDKWTINSSGDVSMTGDLTMANATKFTITQGTLAEKIQLWTGYTLGIQTNTMYWRVGATVGSYAWFQGGTHSDTQFASTGGTLMMKLDGSANLTVTGAITAGTTLGGNNAAVVAGNGNGYFFWSSTTTYGSYMSSSGDATWGGRVAGETTSDYNTYFLTQGGVNRGFVFRNGTTKVAGIDGAGNVRAVGDITAFSSDGRLKKNKKRITNALDILRSKSGYSYDWDMPLVTSLGLNPQVEHEHGLIAQEWLHDAPDVVRPAPFNADYFTIKYDRITPFLLEGIKELDEKVDDKYSELRSEYDQLRAEFEALKALIKQGN